GGEPAASSLPNPVVLYTQPGSYDVELRLFSNFGEQAVQAASRVTVYARPLPAFSYTADGLRVTFENASQQADTYVWNFGDGSSSTQPSPVHDFPAPGLYEVTLNATNPNCSRSVTQSVFLQPTSTAAVADVPALR
ncbi:PKD domain-containing protein, partial [Arthrospira platensis SPKY1]|nr:PKD domain-containing protein [Arthrospira platensis SPKY1]